MILGNNALKALSLKGQVQVQKQVPQLSIMFIMQLMKPDENNLQDFFILIKWFQSQILIYT
jgi:hypothetical protein